MTAINNFPPLNGEVPTLDEVSRRKEHVKKIIIWHPSYQALFNEVKECHILSKGSSSPDSLFISGKTGVGKSTLLEEYTSHYPREVLEEYTRVPVLHVKIPVGATPKSVATTILDKLGDPNYDRGTEINQTARLYKLFKKCQVEMIILDEFQHLIDKETQKVLKKASDWVKRFTEEIQIPVVLCGMPESEDIFGHNEQLDRRFCNKQELKAFSYNTGEDQKEFRTFLYYVDQQLPFCNPSRLADPSMSERIFYISLGVPFYVMTLLQKATEYAVKHGQDQISDQYLSAAYNSIKRSTRPHAVNPFIEEKFDLIDALNEEAKASERYRINRKAK